MLKTGGRSFRRFARCYNDPLPILEVQAACLPSFLVPAWSTTRAGSSLVSYNLDKTISLEQQAQSAASSSNHRTGKQSFRKRLHTVPFSRQAATACFASGHISTPSANDPSPAGLDFTSTPYLIHRLTESLQSGHSSTHQIRSGTSKATSPPVEAYKTRESVREQPRSGARDGPSLGHLVTRVPETSSDAAVDRALERLRLAVATPLPHKTTRPPRSRRKEATRRLEHRLKSQEVILSQLSSLVMLAREKPEALSRSQDRQLLRWVLQRALLCEASTSRHIERAIQELVRDTTGPHPPTSPCEIGQALSSIFAIYASAEEIQLQLGQRGCVIEGQSTIHQTVSPSRKGLHEAVSHRRKQKDVTEIVVKGAGSAIRWFRSAGVTSFPITTMSLLAHMASLAQRVHHTTIQLEPIRICRMANKAFESQGPNAPSERHLHLLSALLDPAVLQLSRRSFEVQDSAQYDAILVDLWTAASLDLSKIDVRSKVKYLIDSAIGLRLMRFSRAAIQAMCSKEIGPDNVSSTDEHRDLLIAADHTAKAFIDAGHVVEAHEMLEWMRDAFDTVEAQQSYWQRRLEVILKRAKSSARKSCPTL